MPMFYFDAQNGRAYTDNIGSEHADLKSVRDEVRHALTQAAADITNSDAFQVRMDVRDEHGNRVITATIMMIVEETR